MANNPIDTNSFEHFLLIRGVEYEIIEPVNFDKSNFKCEQGNYARDTFYGNEEELLEFYQNYGSQGTTFINNDGVLVRHLPSGLDYLVQENKDNGSESDVKYILKKDGLEFTSGNFDFTTADTDNVTYFKCKVIQNTNQSKIKKREKLNIDLLATKDLDDNTISAIPIQKMLLKAKPLYSESIHENSENIFYTQGYPNTPEFFNSIRNIKQQNSLNNALSWISLTEVGDQTSQEVRDVGKMVKIEDDLIDVNININLDYTVSYFNNQFNAPIQLLCKCFVSSNDEAEWLANINDPVRTFYSKVFNSGDVVNLNQTYTINYPFAPNGKFIYVVFISVSSNDGNAFLQHSFRNSTIDINSSSTAIDSVINAVRWIDLIKQNYKGIGSLPVNAPKFDVGGEFYDNFCFTKNLIKQDLTKPFNIKLTDTIGSLEELNADAQINDNEIYIGQYGDFYNNIDMGGFLSKADFESNFIKNDRYLVNSFVFGYEKFEQDRFERNTIDAIHTNSEWFPQVKNSINTKEFKAPFVRDSFSIETTRKSVFSVNNNSDTTDDNIFIVDVIQLAPNSRNKFTRLLTWKADGGTGTTKILSDNTFTWDKLGFNVGDVIIESGVNRTVLSITPTILTLSFSGGVETGTDFLTFDYPLTNVLYTNRTNEGLIFSENLRNSDNFGNLRYSIKRNMKHWYSVLATYGKFIPNKKIKNTYFKSNGYATTQFIGEPLPIKENADINISDISSYKILTQDLYKTRVRISWLDSVQLLKDIQNIRGFIRVQNPNGAIIKAFIKEANFIWTTEELSLILEIKNESDFLNISYNSGILTINEVGYTEKTTNIKNYNIFNDFIQFFDNNSINLCNRTRFDKVALNGITYDNIDNLVNAIENL